MNRIRACASCSHMSEPSFSQQQALVLQQRWDLHIISYDGHTTHDLKCPLETLTPAQTQLLSDCGVR